MTTNHDMAMNRPASGFNMCSAARISGTDQLPFGGPQLVWHLPFDLPFARVTGCHYS
jgi:hypothetical protein